jgi:hypothetical protein
MQEQYANVLENKGPGFHSPTNGGNVIENKDTYEIRAGMLLKTKVVGIWNSVSGSWYVVVGGSKAGLGFQVRVEVARGSGRTEGSRQQAVGTNEAAMHKLKSKI